MSVSITQVENFAVEVLNASQPGSPYGTIVSRRFKDGEAKDSILLGDASTVRSFLNIRGHGRRKDFLTGSAAGLAHGAQLATRIGPLETIVFAITGGEYAGTVLPVEWADTDSNRQELLQENRNVTAEELIEPHYIISGSTIFHNGAGLILGGASVVSVNATWCNFTLTAACQSPDEFVRAVALAALAIEMMKDGQRVGAGNMFENMFRAEMREKGRAECRITNLGYGGGGLMARTSFRVGSKVKVLIDGRWAQARIASFHDAEKRVAIVERSDVEGPADQRTAYARTEDLRSVKDEPEPKA